MIWTITNLSAFWLDYSYGVIRSKSVSNGGFWIPYSFTGTYDEYGVHWDVRVICTPSLGLIYRSSPGTTVTIVLLRILFGYAIQLQLTLRWSFFSFLVFFFFVRIVIWSNCGWKPLCSSHNRLSDRTWWFLFNYWFWEFVRWKLARGTIPWSDNFFYLFIVFFQLIWILFQLDLLRYIACFYFSKSCDLFIRSSYYVRFIIFTYSHFL